MGSKTIPVECPVCGVRFLARSDQSKKAPTIAEGGEFHGSIRVPCCSRECEQERRHKATRDKKFAKALNGQTI